MTEWNKKQGKWEEMYIFHLKIIDSIKWKRAASENFFFSWILKRWKGKRNVTSLCCQRFTPSPTINQHASYSVTPFVVEIQRQKQWKRIDRIYWSISSDGRKTKAILAKRLFRQRMLAFGPNFDWRRVRKEPSTARNRILCLQSLMETIIMMNIHSIFSHFPNLLFLHQRKKRKSAKR